MINNILIAGVGQLGSRYLQGLVDVSFPLEIWVIDIAQESLVRAEKRWKEVSSKDNKHAVHYSLSYDTIPKCIDLAIVPTYADVRPEVIAQIYYWSSVSYIEM